MFLLYIGYILHISQSTSFASEHTDGQHFTVQKNRIISSNITTISVNVMPSIAACASVCSSDQHCCSSSYETSTRFCTLDTCSTPETETTDHSKVIVKNPAFSTFLNSSRTLMMADTDAREENEDDLGKDVLLIELYEAEPALWDVHSAAYRDKYERKKSVDRIDSIMKIGADKILKKVNNLRTYYKKEVNKVDCSKRSGSGVHDIYESKWPMFIQMDKFLRPQVQKRKSDSNLTLLNENTEVIQVLDDSDVSPSPRKAKQTTSDGKKVKVKLEDQLMFKAIESLSSTGEEETEDYCFGKLVGKSLSAMPNTRTKMMLKHKIQNIMYETQLMFLPAEVPNNQLYQNPSSFNFNHYQPFVNEAPLPTLIHNTPSKTQQPQFQALANQTPPGSLFNQQFQYQRQYQSSSCSTSGETNDTSGQNIYTEL